MDVAAAAASVPDEDSAAQYLVGKDPIALPGSKERQRREMPRGPW